MVIDRNFIKRITSSKGTLYNEQRRLLDRVLPESAKTIEEITEALKGVQISEQKADELIRLRKWAKKIHRQRKKEYAKKRKGR